MFQSILLPFIIGGHLATAPIGVVKYEISDNNGVAHCTATVAKDYKIYSAAHCAVVSGKQEIILHNVRYEVKFDDISEEKDTAIGHATTPLRVMPDKLMETDFSERSNGDEITLGGFGCYNTNEDIDFQYREGTSHVATTAANGFTTNGGAVVCPGDSGGMAQANGKLIGIISAVSPWSTSYLVQP